MAKIIQFPAKSSNAYTNLEQQFLTAQLPLINISWLLQFVMKPVIFFPVKSKS